MRVLLVEDDEPIAESLRRGLRRYGFEVDWVATGRDALAAGPTDLVLLDLGLPDTDGLDVCRELRARGDVPIIVISARSDETDRVVGLELGAGPRQSVGLIGFARFVVADEGELPNERDF